MAPLSRDMPHDGTGDRLRSGGLTEQQPQPMPAPEDLVPHKPRKLRSRAADHLDGEPPGQLHAALVTGQFDKRLVQHLAGRGRIARLDQMPSPLITVVRRITVPRYVTVIHRVTV
ncbi:hypothetical protein [Streptomyces lutosisoli]|uniref:Transposase n=1 Tax=Streptomyces lutosisoli TaxID=2665721 RepID=A0ABW2VK45_9ACTN